MRGCRVRPLALEASGAGPEWIEETGVLVRSCWALACSVQDLLA